MAIAPKAGFARTLLATVALGAMSFTGTVAIGMPLRLLSKAGRNRPRQCTRDRGRSLILPKGSLMQSSIFRHRRRSRKTAKGMAAFQCRRCRKAPHFRSSLTTSSMTRTAVKQRFAQSAVAWFRLCDRCRKGYIVTNNHVIADADEIEVNFVDGSKLKAELVGKDTKTDLAVLKVDPAKHKLTAVQFGNSEKARIGDWVLAIGNPFGLGGTVTAGIISARKRDIQSGPYDDFIQTDAAINRGNSGGPLFDMDGKVIGINTAIYSPSGGSIGIGFAIPAEMAVGVIDQLKEFGEVRRGWLGVRLQPVTEDIAQSLGLKDAKGALIAGLIENSGVDNTAIKAGDVVIRYDGKPVERARDLPRLVAESAVGDEVDIVVVRDGEEKP